MGCPVSSISKVQITSSLQLVWKEKYNSKLNKIIIGLDVEGTKAEVPIFRARTPRETAKRREDAKFVAAEV